MSRATRRYPVIGASPGALAPEVPDFLLGVSRSISDVDRLRAAGQTYDPFAEFV